MDSTPVPEPQSRTIFKVDDELHDLQSKNLQVVLFYFIFEDILAFEYGFPVFLNAWSITKHQIVNTDVIVALEEIVRLSLFKSCHS
jgi:hypothetical protein